jgi:formate dehydrogenase major subunit
LIQSDVAKAMGHAASFSFDSPEDIWNEVRRVWPAGAGISYARLEHGGLQWPCPTENHPGTEVLHVGRFSAGDRVSFALVDHLPSEESADDEYPLILVTGRKLHQFNAGTMTLRTKNRELRPADCLEVSPTDAERLGLREGAIVTVRSRYGAVRLPVSVTSRVRSGELFTTFHTADAFVNRLTGPRRDAVTGTPEYKVTAVRIEP